MNSGDTAWVLVSSSLVMLMTPAVGLFYGGMGEQKNLLSTIMLSFATLLVVTLQWIVLGYSLSFGPDFNHFCGNLDWCGLAAVTNAISVYAPTIPHTAFMLFQMKFAIITPALITGAFVDRVRFSTFVVFTLLWTTLVYDPVAHWVWGEGGWLRSLGALDFAGGTVVHITAGVAALAISICLRRRARAFDGRFQPVSVPLTLFGAVLLWFGWFGFNGGSALGANHIATQALITTNVAAAAAALTWMLISMYEGKASAVGAATGAVVGLVAITPACGYVNVFSAMIIGAVGSLVSYFSIKIGEHFKIQDSLDVCACHGMAGTWGAIATGIFASRVINPQGGEGLIHGNWELLRAQVLSVAVVWIFTFLATYILVKVIDKLFHFTVTESEQMAGLDLFHYGNPVLEKQPSLNV
jgi:Amt family ammonium transporter